MEVRVMDTFQFTLRLSDTYFSQLKALKLSQPYKIGRCWFDPKAVTDKKLDVNINSEGIRIAYRTKKHSVTDACTFMDVSTLIETKQGILIRVEQKGFLFLPVSENGADNENLMEILRFLSDKCKYIHKYANLSLPGVPFRKKFLFRVRPKQGFYLNPYKPFLMILPILLVGLFISVVMVSMIFQRPELTKEEATSLTATYLSCDPYMNKHKINSVDLVFSDAEELTIDGCCASKSLVEQLQATPAGTKMKLLIHPVSKEILEIEINGTRLLIFSESLTKLRREAFGFLGLGILMLISCIVVAYERLRKKQ